MTPARPGPDPAGERGQGWRERWPTTASVLVSVLLAPALVYGLTSSTAYRGYPHEVVVTSRAQDVLTAFVLPLLVWTSVRARRGSLSAHVAWLGLLFYLAYSYALYLVGWQQNRAFLVYAVVVTLSVAALLDGVGRIDVRAVQPAVRGLRTRALGWFLVVVGTLFVGLWLSDVAPSTWGGRPPGHLGPGGTPYAVYVLDLTVALPVVIAVGVLMIRSHPMAAVLGGVVLVKVLTLFTALWLGVLAALVGGEHVGFTADMVPSAVLLLVTATALVTWHRRAARPGSGWLRVRLWPSVLPGPDIAAPADEASPAGGSFTERIARQVPAHTHGLDSSSSPDSGGRPTR